MCACAHQRNVVNPVVDIRRRNWQLYNKKKKIITKGYGIIDPP